jgi:serine protease AprX
LAALAGVLLVVAPALGLGGPAPDAGSGSGGATAAVGGYDPVAQIGSLRNTTLTTGARRLWREGITGRGIDVAVIDSGVSPVAGLDAPGKVVQGPDFAPKPGTAPAHLDRFGHGTHMAGIIAGRDASVGVGDAAGESEAFLGMAPDARVINVRAADARGDTDLRGLVAAIDWVVRNRDADGLRIRVLNLSFAADPAAGDVAPLTAAVERAWRSGIVVVAAVGNAPGEPEPEPALGLAAPALARAVLAVGAADPQGTLDPADDTVADFSRIAAPGAVRTPDLLAPGVSIASLRVPGSFIDRHHGATGRASERLFRGSGTSQAAAVVSGAAALVLQRRPDLTPDQVRDLLRSSALELPGRSPAAQGAGELNLGGVLERMDAGAGSGDDAALTGRSWSGRSWSGRSWSGRSWSGRSWSGRSWSGRSWSGRSWSGRSWSGRSWSGRSWSGRSWSAAGWS